MFETDNLQNVYCTQPKKVSDLRAILYPLI